MSVAASPQGRLPLAFLLAASHSGSTLLSMLLGSHPAVCSVGELKLTALGDVDKYRCSCGQPVRACRFWMAVRSGMAARGFDFDVGRAGTDFRAVATSGATRLLKPLYRGGLAEVVRSAALSLSPGWRRSLAGCQDRNAALVATLLSVTGKRCVVDSSKVGMRLRFLLENPRLDVRVIRLVRDGRAVSATYLDPARLADASRPELRGGGMGGDRDRERLPMRAAAREWRRSNEEAQALLRLLDPSRWIEVRYESVCLDPAAEVGRVLRFLGEDPGLQPGDFRAVEHHVVGNGMRLDGTSEVRLDERWRAVLSSENLAEFEEVAGGLNRRLGYV